MKISRIVESIIDSMVEDATGFTTKNARYIEYEDAVKSALIMDHGLHHGVENDPKFAQCVEVGFERGQEPYVLADFMMKMGFGASGF
jgi:hypothetical protein